tara:strand:- start:698 stop:976 length:279 start_codon:yes stop_codon:yes gene_type:complete
MGTGGSKPAYVNRFEILKNPKYVSNTDVRREKIAIIAKSGTHTTKNLKGKESNEIHEIFYKLSMTKNGTRVYANKDFLIWYSKFYPRYHKNS